MTLVSKIGLYFGLLIAGYVMTVVITDRHLSEEEDFLIRIEENLVPNIHHVHEALVAGKQMMTTFQDAVVFSENSGVDRGAAFGRQMGESLRQVDSRDSMSVQHHANAEAIADELRNFLAEAVPVYRRMVDNSSAGDLPRLGAKLKRASEKLIADVDELQQRMRMDLNQAFQDRRGHSRRYRVTSEFLMVVVLLTAATCTIMLIVSLSRRLERLNAASARLSSGDFLTKVVDPGRDEVARLAHGFEAMRQAIAQRNRELEDFNRGLDSLVQLRTVELETRNQELSTQIHERQRAEQQLVLVESAVDQIGDGVLIAAATPLKEMVPDYVNPAFRRVLGLGDDELPGGGLVAGFDAGSTPHGALGDAWQRAIAGYVSTVEVVLETSDHRKLISEWMIAPIRNRLGQVANLMIILRDVSERRQQEAQRQQGQKMESVGQLAAGIAHEINTPIQFIGDNLRFLDDSFGDLARVHGVYGRILAQVRDYTELKQMVGDVDAELQRADLDYLTAEIPKAIVQSLDGVRRVAEIVRAMKEFSHPDQAEKKPADLNKAIQTTLIVARNEYKYVADLVTDLAEDLPLVSCIVGEINQVVLNLVVNAAHAIGDVVARSGGRGTITVSTRRVDDGVEIRVADTGSGIPASVQHRIFDPFFTTKEVGRGTGQGLYIAHTVVTKQHRGSLSFETEPGCGTTFIIWLPATDVPS